MITTKSIKTVGDLVARARVRGKRVGFVPTMGALHQGHLSLVNKARKECDYVVVSVFVNPAQFGPGEDFQAYPKPVARDKQLLKQAGVDVVFLPSAKTMYPKGFSTYVNEEVLSLSLCGKSRPGHFRGVCTVVTKLFNIVQPHYAYFGQKDYQQARIIEQLVKDLNIGVKIRILPIVREKDGLAMSSRNVYLSPAQRQQVPLLYQSLRLAKKQIAQGMVDSKVIKAGIRKVIQSVGKIDYIEIVDAQTLKPCAKVKGKVLIALAVFVGKARLIDNVLVR